LIEHEIKFVDNYGNTPLMCAAENGRLEVVKLLTNKLAGI
jgi:ankyrin repeat protein